MKNLGGYHDFQVQTNTSYKTDPAKFVSAPGSAWQAAL